MSDCLTSSELKHQRAVGVGNVRRASCPAICVRRVAVRAAIFGVAAALAGQAHAGAPDMVRIDEGTFRMGSAGHYREEGPVREVSVAPFLIGRTEVTNAEFAAFVDATGYMTTAERALDPAEYPDWPEALLQPGSMVFAQPDGAVALDDPTAWWRYVPGANWRHPTGPESTIDGLDDHPVVQVSPEDAAAYAAWADGRLHQDSSRTGHA